MSKSGRYSADRKKIENITGNKAITVADCGTIFTIGAAAATLTLPPLAKAGKGWWARFVVNDETAQVIITQDSGDSANQMVGHVLTTAGDNSSVQIQPTTPGDPFDTITFTADVLQGDHVEIYTDGSLWYVSGYSAAVDKITCA